MNLTTDKDKKKNNPQNMTNDEWKTTLKRQNHMNKRKRKVIMMINYNSHF